MMDRESEPNLLSDAPWFPTRWIVTWTAEDDDGRMKTVHLAGETREEMISVVERAVAALGASMRVEPVEVPSTWHCDGGDSCLHQA